MINQSEVLPFHLQVALSSFEARVSIIQMGSQLLREFSEGSAAIYCPKADDARKRKQNASAWLRYSVELRLRGTGSSIEPPQVQNLICMGA